MTPDAAGMPPEAFEAFLSDSRNGYVYTDPDGRIIYANARFAHWLQMDAAALIGTRLVEYFPIVRRVYYETHLAPLLRMQGYFDEVALELSCANGSPIPVMIGGSEVCDATGKARFVRFTLFAALERRQYERNLIAARAAAVADNSKLRDLNTALGGQIADHTRERVKIENDLSGERQSSALREQFIAVLGHDLRNPLAAIKGGLRLIAKTPLTERAASIVGMAQQSADRMAALISDVMDFARGRLGGGIEISARPADLSRILTHVVDELRTGFADRVIVMDIQTPKPVLCDANRIAQLLSNLLANALTHGAADSPVRVIADQVDGILQLVVINSGDPIPAEAMEKLFQPFSREDVRPGQQGLGLGLYIASEIARGHGGSLSATSSAAETCFTFRMPMG